jgi:chaperone protein EcpD
MKPCTHNDPARRGLRVVVRAAFAVVAIACAMVTPVHAGVVIEGTRVVYPTDQREVVVRMSNKRTYPVLVESWIECPDATASQPSACTAPFVLTPPLFRLDPNKGQSLRIFQAPGARPTDRESLYYFNVRDVPPKADGDGVALAFRSRLKLFHRPSTLKMSVDDAPMALRWHVGGRNARVENPTPFFMTIIALEPTGGTAQQLDGVMVAPFSHLDIPLSEGNTLRPAQALHYTVVNDLGGPVRVPGKVEAAP